LAQAANAAQLGSKSREIAYDGDVLQLRIDLRHVTIFVLCDVVSIATIS